MKTLLVLLLLTSATTADTLRLKVRPASGELIKTDKPCGKETVAAVWKIVFKAPYLEIVDDVMIAAVGEDKRAADRNAVGEPFVGFFDQSDKKTIAITIRRARAITEIGRKATYFATEIAIIMRDTSDRQNACATKWLGLSERL